MIMTNIDFNFVPLKWSQNAALDQAAGADLIHTDLNTKTGMFLYQALYVCLYSASMYLQPVVFMAPSTRCMNNA